MTFELSVILSLSSIFIAGILALIRFKKIRQEFYPFIFLLWLGCINESISTILAFNYSNSIINGTIYGLCESIFLLWFFRNLGIFDKHKLLLFGFLILFIVIWVIESFFSKNFGTKFNSYFGISYSLSVVLLSIHSINRLIFKEREILKNPIFLICVGFVVFFTYKVVIETFWAYGLKESRSFRINVYTILIYINLVCNLIYALAILWMRKKQAFTLQF
jgi:hypothetical protein